MRLRIIGTTLAFLAFAIFSIAVTLFASEPQPQAHAHGPDAWAARARAKGETEVTVRTIVDESEGFSLTAMFECFSVVVAKPVFVITLKDEQEIRTWYTFRISETLSRAKKTCPPMGTLFFEVPAIVPQGGGQIVVPVIGGRVDIDGVSVNQVCAESPQLQTGKSYLLFLHFTSDSTALIGVHGSGAYEIAEDGTLRGTISKPSPVKRRILALQTLSRLRREIASSSDR